MKIHLKGKKTYLELRLDQTQQLYQWRFSTKTDKWSNGRKTKKETLDYLTKEGLMGFLLV